jgi:hypothetical protein
MEIVFLSPMSETWTLGDAICQTKLQHVEPDSFGFVTCPGIFWLAL